MLESSGSGKQVRRGRLNGGGVALPLSGFGLLLALVVGVAGCGPTGSRGFEAIAPSNARADARAGLAEDAPVAQPPARNPAETSPPWDSSAEAGVSVQSVPDAIAEVEAPAADVRPELATKVLAAPCSAGHECASGFCSDGVCCDAACTSSCHHCNATGTAGRCLPAATGEDPRDDCSMEPVTTCGRDGSCDGTGDCRLYAVTTECQPGGCVDAKHERSARLCDGHGVCQASTTRACTSASCQSGSCGTSCANADGCLPGFACVGGACQLKRPPGRTCVSPEQCASGVCTDGICCNVACDGLCASCSLPGKQGTCSPVAAGTVCAPASCTANIANAARACDARGTCQPAVRTDCLAFSCSNGRCPTTCTPAAGCTAGFVCAGIGCVSEGLLVYWRFDEASEQAAVKDDSGQGLDGIYVGPPVPSPSLPPTRFPDPLSRSFEIAKRHAALIPALPLALQPTSALTMAVWYRSSGIAPGARGAELISLGNNHLLRLLPAGFEVSKRVQKGGSFQHVRCLSAPARTDHLDGQWHHLASVIDGDGVRIYFDGARVCNLPNSDPLAYDLVGSFAAGRHGQTDGLYDFAGNLDDLRVYSRALALPEIIALAAGLP
jgi:hypothetical protein